MSERILKIQSERILKTQNVVLSYIGLMFSLILIGLFFPVAFHEFFVKPDFYIHAKFAHIVSVTLVFANAVIGTFWESRALFSKDPTVIRHTYKTVVWLDAVFTAPLILISVLSGILLGTTLGGIWTIGWLSIAFVTYLVCGVVWIAIDIPSQYKIKRLFLVVPLDATALPPELMKCLWFRLKLNLLTLIPLLFIFYLMVHKPELRSVSSWFS